MTRQNLNFLTQTENKLKILNFWGNFQDPEMAYLTCPNPSKKNYPAQVKKF